MIHRKWGRLVKDVREDCTYYFNEYPFARTCLRKVNGKGGESTTVLLADNTWIPSKRDVLKVNSPDVRMRLSHCCDDSREVFRTLWIDMSDTVGHNEHKEFGKLHRNYNLEGDTMSYHDVYYSEFQGYKEVKDHFVADCNVARMSHGFDLREKDGVYSFGRDIHDGGKDSDGKYIGKHQVDVEYHEDGTIILKKTMLKDLAKNKYNMGSFLRWLPDSVHLYEHSKKMYLIYTPEQNARNNHSNPVLSVWEWLGTNDITLYKDGSVEEEPSLIKIERGKTKTAEDKPLKEQLNEKHYREIAKARLETDLQVQLNTMYATFRGQPTSLYHIAIELFRPSIYGNGGPNEGLIRRLYVGRFIDKTNREKYYELAGKIVGSDIPTSAIVGELKNYV